MGETRRRSVILSALYLLLGAAPALAQTGAITGRLNASDTGRPVVSAVVEAVERNGRVAGSALSNNDGLFRIRGLGAGTYSLAVSVAGYASPAGVTAQVAAGGTANVAISLEPKAFELNPVVVSASKKQEKALEAPARVEVVSEREIDVRPALSPVDHLRSTPGVDIITSGLQSTNVVARGFNNIFSGALHALTDNRIAGIPSLRVNLLHFVPQTSDDISRMEVVLGPGSALYGPNTANGVLHMITKSPIDEPGSSVSVAGGERSVLQFGGRTAVRVSEHFGFKVSGQYFKGNEWNYEDPVELAAKQLATTDFRAWSQTQPVNILNDTSELRRRAARLAARDFDLSRYSLDARVDWRPTGDFSAILSAGRSNVGQGIELTGIGAGMVDDWMYGYYQARFNYRRWFAQAYVNTSDAGDTFLLRTGGPIVDKSKVAVAQLQHVADWRGFEFTYGGDFIRTMPETEGTINGSRENDDNYTEYGAYLQTKVPLGAKLDLVAAARGDWHSELSEPVFSPRAALVIKPVPDQTFRVTYNRAFSTPSSLNLFLDIDGGPAGPLGPLGFRVRAQGPGKDGIKLTDASGMPLGLRSPFSGAPATLQTVTQQNLFDYQLNALLTQVPANLRPLLSGLRTPLKAGIGQVGIATLNPTTRAVAPLQATSITDVPGIQPSITKTFELGYKGLIGDKLLLAADWWRSTQTDFTSPLVVRTPLLLLNPTQFGAYLTQNAAPAMVQALVGSGMSLAQAQATVTGIITNWVQIPAGVVSSPDVAAQGSDLLATYVNFGEMDLWGADLSLQWLMTDEWSATGTYSHTSDHNFCLVPVTGDADCPEDDLVALNAPKDKASASLAFRSAGSGFSSEVRVRHTGEFPVNSADYVGLKCIGGGGEDCVDAFTLFDVTLGYDLPTMPGASVQLAITNLLDEDYRSFVGVPKVGRLALLRLRYEF
jgi:iron complex outermembrane receptor protein